MNDQTQNELLSAYLDGEVTAAERAEVERLLADDPAARQTLDQLCAMHDAIQDLPTHQLGEDLSRQVLQAAESRRANEQSPAVPLGRAVLRRMSNRRLLAWLAVSAMIVVMITIHQQYLGPQQLAHEGRDVAMAVDLREEAPNKARSEAVLSAAPTTPREKTKAVASDMEAAPRQKDDAADQLIIKKEKADPSRFVRRIPDHAAKGQAVAKAAIAPQAISMAAAMIVRCDVTPEAAENKAFDQLLDANGLVSQKQKKVKDAAEMTLEVEGTPSQIQAVLAGLKAQPQQFLAVSVERKPSRKLNKAPAFGPESSGAANQPSVQGEGKLQNGADAKGPAAELPATAPPASPAPRQRVVFIVRIVAPSEPTP